MLLLFGIFAAFFSIGEIELLLNYSVNPETKLDFLTTLLWEILFESGGALITGTGTLLAEQPALLVTAILVFLIQFLLVAIFFWLAAVSQAALLYRIIAIAQEQHLRFKENIKMAIARIWPVLGINIGLQLLLWVGALAIRSIRLVIQPWPFLYPLLTVITILITLIIAFWIKYALLYVVLRRNTMLEGIKNGWLLFKKYWVITVEFSLALFIIIWAAMTLIANVFSLIASNAIIGLRTTPVLALVASQLIFAIVLIIQLLAMIFYWSNWTLVFEYLNTKNSLISRTSIVLKKILKR